MASDARAFSDELTALERQHGGFVTGLPILAWSEHAPPPVLPWLQGGDRMAHHDYAEHYARELIGRRYDPLVLVEIGVLQGTGLATWSAALPNATIIGLDIDLQHFHSCGRSPERVETHLYDQLHPGDPGRFLAGRAVDVYIDDGLHTDEAIATSLDAFAPHLAERCVGFVEDNPNAGPVVQRVLGPDWTVQSHGELTVFMRRTEQ